MASTSLALPCVKTWNKIEHEYARHPMPQKELHLEQLSKSIEFRHYNGGWEYRQIPSKVRVSRLTHPKKARHLGYKSKQGYVVYRVHVKRGGRKRLVSKGIVSSTLTESMRIQHINTKVILVDAAHAAVRNDPRINWICNTVHKHRKLCGVTSAGKKSRGLRRKKTLSPQGKNLNMETWKRSRLCL
ncbi:hypothetical protein KY290_033761 [Solanum tuberosum]|uniref:Ribosomal protein L15 n=2 Tax=Solanum tuberosum TaxID=4113 RepID=A0ABQ7U316_SOLTU|nr:hypothetical protein KY289_033137 [Solanum tuberosum]KAH0647777.1 hypothetical protein KY285_033025 [Solanum tuberosum]KAH0740718.1 hypothetical protein KY290_033761 [Solanum tuberosum]